MKRSVVPYPHPCQAEYAGWYFGICISKNYCKCDTNNV